MSLQGYGRLYQHARGRVVIYVPAGVHKDSAFPFKIGERVRIRIEKDKLVIEKEEA